MTPQLWIFDQVHSTNHELSPVEGVSGPNRYHLLTPMAVVPFFYKYNDVWYVGLYVTLDCY